MEHKNEWGQPISFPIQDWQPCDWPPHTPMLGRLCRLEPTQPAHAAELYEALVTHGQDKFWTYLPYGPFDRFELFKAWVDGITQGKDPQFYTIFDLEKNIPVGVASLMRIAPELGSVEVGHIHFSTLIQKTPIATEAMYLMMKRAFDELGYRRYEWKCDSLNRPSRRAAERFGFLFEGIFRQHRIYRGRNRDTSWYSIIDSEWPTIKQGFEAWLDPSNFDESGKQKQKLSQLR